MAACISGAVASALSFDQIGSGDQVGLLLGKVVIDVKDTVSDSQISNTKVDTSVHIFSHVPCPYSLRFYDRTGKVVDSNLKTLIKEREKEIVGWYRFRRHSSLRVSLRETAVHRNLMQTLRIPDPEHFVFLLTTASATTNLSTHSYDNVIYKLNSSNEFSKLSLSVINLGDTTHSQYKQHSSIVTSQGNGRYQSVIKKFENLFHDETGEIKEVSLIQELAANLISQLEKISLQVCVEEKQLEELQKEVEKYEQISDEQKNRTQSGVSPVPQIENQNSGVQDYDENNTTKQNSNRETVALDKERLITAFLDTDEQSKIQLENRLTKSQQGNYESGIFRDQDNLTSSMNETQAPQNSGDGLLQQIDQEHNVNLSVPLKPSPVSPTCNNSLVDSGTDNNKKTGFTALRGSHVSGVTTATVRKVEDDGARVSAKKGGSSSDHFSFVENVLKEAKEPVGGEEAFRLDNCVTVPMGAELQSPPGIANLCSQMTAQNCQSKNNSPLPDSGTTSARRRTRSRPDQQTQSQSQAQLLQQQQAGSSSGSGSVSVSKAPTVTHPYSPLSGRTSSPSPTPVASSGSDSQNNSTSPRRVRTPPARATPVPAPGGQRESRIDSNRASVSLNKEVSPVRRCRPSRPKERTLSGSNSPNRREAGTIDYNTVRCERSASPFF